MKICELLDMIRKQDLVLPEFQREYVWKQEQAKQLVDSLVRRYPVGALLFWKTDQPPQLKNVDRLPDKLGTVQVILDGQQRLTTLYLLIEGEIPPYYREKDITMDHRNLYYNVDTGELQYYQPLKMEGNALWHRVTDCFRNPDAINVFEIAKRLAAEDSRAFELAQHFNKNLNRLVHIKELDLPVQTVPSGASLEEAIDTFDRVNTQGTKLTDAELALTHVTGKWPEARRTIKGKIDELRGKHFCFDLTFMTRALTVVVCQGALFETIHRQPKERLQAGWKTLSAILDYLVSLLPQKAYIHSTEDLNSTNTLIPLVAYLALHKGHFPSEQAIKHAMHWLYAAHTWARYTAQTDQRLDHDVAIVKAKDEPWKDLREQIIDQRGRIDVKGSDFEGREAQHPLYRMVFILAKAHGAVDWFNGTPLGATHGVSYKIHSHHVFPQSVLYENGYDPQNHLHRKIVNQIANRAFLTAEANIGLKDRLPEDYFPEVEEHFPGALAKQFIPMDQELWRLDRFESFLEARRELLARKLNDYLKGLIEEPVEPKERPLAEIIRSGEGPRMEFKSTLQWDVVQNRQNTRLRHAVLKTLAGFLNTEGGMLVIGIEDSGAILGLEHDLRLLGGSRDKFQQLLSSLILEHLGAAISALIRIRFEDIDAKTLCVIEVDKAPEPVFLKGEHGKEFYIRMASTTRALDPEQTVGYISSHWE